MPQEQREALERRREIILRASHVNATIIMAVLRGGMDTEPDL